MFGHRSDEFGDVIDGLSNTVMLSEKVRCGNNTGGYTATANELDHRFGHAIRDVRPNPALWLTTTDGRYYVAGVTVERTFGSASLEAVSIAPVSTPFFRRTGRRASWTSTIRLIATMA